MEKPIGTLSKVAATDLSAKRGYAVTVDSNAKFAIAGVRAEGVAILIEPPSASGAICTGVTHGVATAIYGGTVTAGNKLATDANGKLVAANPGDPVVGRALTSGVSGDMGTVLLGGASEARGGRIMQFTFDLADISAASIVNNFVPGFSGTIKKLSAVVLKAATTAAKAATVGATIGGVATTGGVLSLTSANMTPIGAVVDSTAVTALGSFSDSDQIDLVGSAVTAFVEGRAVLSIHCD